MPGLIAGVATGVAGALIFAALARLAGQPVRWVGLFAALGLLLAYWGVVVIGAAVQDVLPFAAGLRWNWAGKAISAAASLIAAFVVLRGRVADAGFTLRQARGSLGPALLCAALLCAASWGAEALAGDGRDMSLERLAFQASMPGLDEELFFRGLLLAVVVRAAPDRGRLLGAPLGLASLIVTFIFAAGHGVGWGAAGLEFDPQAFAVTGALGAGLLWMRQRTGSVLLPIAAHNLINVGNSFF